MKYSKLEELDEIDPTVTYKVTVTMTKPFTDIYPLEPSKQAALEDMANLILNKKMQDYFEVTIKKETKPQ